MNLLEEINFFKDYNVGIMIPFYASILKVPNLIFIMSPFIILFSTVWLFLKIIKSGEIVVIKVSGFSNLTLMLIPSLVAFIFGILIIIGFNPLTAALTKSYYDLKADYSKSNDYMASVTINGIWIKEKNPNKTSIIRSSNLKEDTLLNVSIYQFDEDFKSTMRIEAREANIENKNWILKNARVFQEEENIKVKNFSELEYASAYDLKNLKNLYGSLDSVSIWDLQDIINVYKDRGYSTLEMEAKLQRLISYPFFLLGMVLLASVSILSVRFKGKFVKYILLSVVTSIIVYYFNDFSKALGETGQVPLIVSVWMPILVILIFSSIGIIHVNQK